MQSRDGLRMLKRTVATIASAFSVGIPCVTTSAWAGAVWDATRPDQIRIERLPFGDALYSNVVVRMSEVLHVGRTSTGRTRDHFDWLNNTLTLATVQAAQTTYHDVVVRIGGVLDTGFRAPLPEWLPNDPLFVHQWHLRNTGQASNAGVVGVVGEDLRVTKAWQYATGRGIRMAIVDDGLDVSHPDLNVVMGQSWDFGTQTYGDPSSRSSYHGTATAGLAAARGSNALGVTGVAFDAEVVGYNLLPFRSDANSTKAMTLDVGVNDIYVNSYGATDGRGHLQPAPASWSEAVYSGVTLGRQGKGSVYVWAGGNGAPVDRSDYDGQANHPAVVAVAAVDSSGKATAYSESGANVLVAAPGGDYCNVQSLYTTDVQGLAGFNAGSKFGFDLPGEPDYTRCMNGTSAAAPLVAGVIALMLEVNPSLTWRDVRAILALTARKNDPANLMWVVNGAGRPINEIYGFGVVDAFAAVVAAQQWRNLPSAKSVAMQSEHIRLPGNTLPVHTTENQVVFEDRVLVASGQLTAIESVELWLQTDASDTGGMSIELQSPLGTTRRLMLPRECRSETGAKQRCGAELNGGFRFSSAHWFGENPSGEWKLRVVDRGADLLEASVLNWRIVVQGFE